MEDIRTAILTTIPNDELKQTAKGAIQFRGVIEFFLEFNVPDIEKILLSKSTWEVLLEKFNIKQIVDINTTNKRTRRSFGVAFLLKDDDSKFFIARYMDLETINTFLKNNWEEFKELPENRKNAIFNAIIDNFVSGRFRSLETINESYADWVKTNDSKD